MSATAGVLVLGFLFCAFLAWKCVELIREAAPRDEAERDPDAPIDYRRFHIERGGTKDND